MASMVPSLPPTQLLQFTEQLIHKLEVELEPGKVNFHLPVDTFKEVGTRIQQPENTAIRTNTNHSCFHASPPTFHPNATLNFNREKAKLKYASDVR